MNQSITTVVSYFQLFELPIQLNLFCLSHNQVIDCLFFANESEFVDSYVNSKNLLI